MSLSRSQYWLRQHHRQHWLEKFLLTIIATVSTYKILHYGLEGFCSSNDRQYSYFKKIMMLWSGDFRILGKLWCENLCADISIRLCLLFYRIKLILGAGTVLDWSRWHYTLCLRRKRKVWGEGKEMAAGSKSKREKRESGAWQMHNKIHWSSISDYIRLKEKLKLRT